MGVIRLVTPALGAFAESLFTEPPFRRADLCFYEDEMSSTTADAAAPSETLATGEREERRVSLFILCLLALGVGIMTGVGAVALRALIGLIHNAMFNGGLQDRL